MAAVYGRAGQGPLRPHPAARVHASGQVGPHVRDQRAQCGLRGRSQCRNKCCSSAAEVPWSTLAGDCSASSSRVSSALKRSAPMAEQAPRSEWQTAPACRLQPRWRAAPAPAPAHRQHRSPQTRPARGHSRRAGHRSTAARTPCPAPGAGQALCQRRPVDDGVAYRAGCLVLLPCGQQAQQRQAAVQDRWVSRDGRSCLQPGRHRGPR